MSKYVVYYNVRQDMYREMAARWAKWSSAANLSGDQRHGMGLFFKSIGRRFGLINEFRELGVITQ
jgi:hypothetical protein